MTAPQPSPTERQHRERVWLAMIAACCAGPMLLIVVLTAVLGIAIGPAAAITIVLVAGGVCVATMVARHRHGARGTDEQ